MAATPRPEDFTTGPSDYDSGDDEIYCTAPGGGYTNPIPIYGDGDDARDDDGTLGGMLWRARRHIAEQHAAEVTP